MKNIIPVDILAIGVHPDDVELSCGGTLLAHAAKGYTFGILDLTKGELGTRGTPELRMEEGKRAAEILGASFRALVGLKDGLFDNNHRSVERIIPFLRAARPRIVLANAIKDRHPDHERAAQLVHDACFLSGLEKIQTFHPQTNEKQSKHRPQSIYHYMQDYALEPDVVVDIKGYIEHKMEAVKAFSSQFYTTTHSGNNEPETPISGPGFMEMVRNRALNAGRLAGLEYGEAFSVSRAIGTDNLMNLF